MLKRESEIYHNKCDSYGISLLSYKSGKSQRKQDQNSPSCSTQTKRTWSEWRPGTRSHAKDKNGPFIGNKNYFLLMKGAACITHGRIEVFMWCDAIILWTDFAGGNSKAKEAHCACKGHEREIQWLFLARNDFNGWLRSWKMDVSSRLPVQRLTSAIRAKKKQGLLICPAHPPLGEHQNTIRSSC